ncbi:AAA family ATPase [Niabella sp. CJ426]|uniref:AAA family ATPase n=1 Tax=Niabella sp. CJ426 TaxID=3393740 RepID=UPI003CFDA94A
MIIFGPRQVGKTTLIEYILKNESYLFLNCDNPTTSSLLTNINTEQLRALIGNYKIVFIDEVQI